MDKNQKKKFTVTVWDGMNMFLAAATAITMIVFIILFVLCFTETLGTDKHGFILGMCGVFASLASAFFIAWIMRVYDIKRKKDQEEKALMLLQPYLAKIFSTIDLFFPQLHSFTTINEDDTIQYPNETVYYTDPEEGHSNRSFVNLTEAFKEAHYNLDRDLADCLSAPILFQCNEEIVNLLTGLKLNGLTENLLEVYKSSLDPFFTNTAYIGIYENYKNFASLYETLATVSGKRPIRQLEELSPEQKKQYIAEIENIRSQITAQHKGRIYKGRDRIQ